MFRYLFSVPTHIRFRIRWMLMKTDGISMNYVYNGSYAYPGSQPRIVPIVPRNPPLGKQEWILLYAQQESNMSRDASTPHRNTWKPTGRTKDFNSTISYTTVNTIANRYPLVSPFQCKLFDYYRLVIIISLQGVTGVSIRRNRQE